MRVSRSTRRSANCRSEESMSSPSTRQSRISPLVVLLKWVEGTDDIKYLMVGYYLSFVFQKGMKDRLQRLERATSYIESFLDVLRRCEILEKDDEKQYEYYLE